MKYPSFHIVLKILKLLSIQGRPLPIQAILCTYWLVYWASFTFKHSFLIKWKKGENDWNALTKTLIDMNSVPTYLSIKKSLTVTRLTFKKKKIKCKKKPQQVAYSSSTTHTLWLYIIRLDMRLIFKCSITQNIIFIFKKSP